MTPDAHRTASSDRYGRPSWLERLGARVGRLVREGPLRRLLRAVFRVMLRITGRHSLRRVLPGGEVVRISPAYRYITWNPVEYAAFHEVLKPGDVALDVGANVGPYALAFGFWVGATGHVYAFEPAAGAFGGLEEHIRRNGLTGRVTAVRAAVADQVGTAEFMSEGAQGTNHLVPLGAPGGAAATVRVPTTTIDTFCAAHGLRPTLIKIDVEGAELAVLRGARRTIAAAGAVFVELHPKAWAAMGFTESDVRAELTAQGLRPVSLRPDVSPWELDGECVRLERG
jgi:FkbM family methyltransferase